MTPGLLGLITARPSPLKEGSGAPDPGFGVGGTFVLQPGDYAAAVLRQTDGKIVVASTFYSPTASTLPVYRLTASGAPDPSFSGDGRACSG